MTRTSWVEVDGKRLFVRLLGFNRIALHLGHVKFLVVNSFSPR
jgi:hypothetical protein